MTVGRSAMSPTPLDRRPLTATERALIRRAENELWSDTLLRLLAQACVNRGLLVGTYDTVDMLVETLEAMAKDA